MGCLSRNDLFLKIGTHCYTQEQFAEQFAAQYHLLLTHARGTGYGRQKTGIFESDRKQKSAARNWKYSGYTTHMHVGIKTLQLIKHFRRNLVPLFHWPYTGQNKTCYPEEVPYSMNRYAPSLP